MAITDTLVAWWDLEEASGTRVDAHGANDLTDNNTVTSNTGQVGTAAEFTAANTESLSITDNTDLSMGAAVDTTFAFWVYFPSMAASYFLSKASGYTAATTEYYFQLLDQGGGDWRIEFGGSDGTNRGGVRNGAGLSATTWYFVSATISNTAGDMTLAINNGTPATASPLTTGFRDGTATFHMGRYGAGGSPAWATCRLDSVGIFKSVLSGTDITTLYNSGAGVAYADLAGGTLYNQSAAGTLTSAGSITRATAKLVAGVLTGAGILARSIGKLLAGTVTSAGAIIRQTQKQTAGVLTTAGDLATAMIFLASLAGILTSSGTVTKGVSRTLSGTLTSLGTLAKQTAKSVAGTLSSSGSLSRVITFLLTIGGTLTPSGTLTRGTQKQLVGVLTTVGQVSKGVSKLFAGTLTSSGALSASRIFLQALAGTLTSAGTLTRSTGKALSGTLASSGTIQRAIAIAVVGTLSLAGAVARTTAKSFAGVLSFAGALVTELTEAASIKKIALTLHARSTALTLRARSVILTLWDRD